MSALWALPIVALGAIALGRRAGAKPAAPGARLLTIRGRPVWTWTPPTSRGPLVVYLHGFGGSAAAVGAALAPMFAAVRVPPLVAIPQLGPKSEPGDLTDPGALARLIADLQKTLGPAVAGPAILLAHSGGYRTAAAFVDHGGAPVRAVGLLDTLYGEEAVFERYARKGGRFANVYGPSTEALSVPLGQRLVAALGPAVAIVGTNATALGHRVATFPSAVGHPEVPARYVTPMLDAFGR